MSDDFEQEVLQRLTKIETQLKDLTGNGSGGRCSIQGARLDKLEKWMYMTMGVVTAIGAITGYNFIGKLFH